MANKISYANLKLKTDTSVSTFDFNNNTIEVLNYLPIESKYDLVMITLQKAEENGIYNPIKLDMYFNLHLVYMYTNLSFTEKQKENESKLYDTLKSNGFIDLLLKTISEDEYNELFTFMDTIVQDTLNYRNTAGAVLQSIINDLPKNARAAAEIVDNFDKEKYQEVINFAKAANGGRSIAAVPTTVE
jgi:hypothetical protein